MANGEPTINDQKTGNVGPLKFCNGCKKEKSQIEFYKKSENSDGLSDRCKGCYLEWSRWYQRKLKKKVFETLCNGAPKCQCCDETREEFLTIDHINGRNERNRKRNGIFTLVDISRLIKKGRSLDEFRVLCMNCNFSFGYRGYCPHEKERKAKENYANLIEWKVA